MFSYRPHSYGRASVEQPTRTYLKQLCTDTGCSLEDLPEAMEDEWRARERERESAKSALATRHIDEEVSFDIRKNNIISEKQIISVSEMVCSFFQ